MAVGASSIFVVGIIMATCSYLYAISSFGNAILFHLAWQMCASGSATKVCSGEVSEAVLYLTVSMLLMPPQQIYSLWAQINWPLALHLTMTHLVGGFIGSVLLFTVTSVWVVRVLGIIFLLVAVQSMVKESHLMSLETYSKMQQNGKEVDPAAITQPDANRGIENIESELKVGFQREDRVNVDDKSVQNPMYNNHTAAAPSNDSISPITSEIVSGISPRADLEEAVEDITDAEALPTSFAYVNLSTTQSPLQAEGTGNQDVMDLAANTSAPFNYKNLSTSSTASIWAHLVHVFTTAKPGHFAMLSKRSYYIVWTAGVVAGLLGGMFGTAGPALMVFVTYARLGKDETRGTFAIGYMAINLERCVMILAYPNDIDVFSPDMGAMSVSIIAGTLLGLYVGEKTVVYISESAFRRIVLCILSIGSALMMTTGANVGTQVGIVVAVVVFFVLLGYVAYQFYMARLSGQNSVPAYGLILIILSGIPSAAKQLIGDIYYKYSGSIMYDSPKPTSSVYVNTDV
jgi:uncharacterized membrane protein YfcA